VQRREPEHSRLPASPAGSRGRSRRAGRFVTYFRLLEACASPGCPVCRCLRAEARSALEALLDERVTDPGTRDVLDRSWGFCAWHGALTREVPSAGLGVAIIYETIVQEIRARLDRIRREASSAAARRPAWRRLLGQASRGATPPLGLPRARAARPRCPLCATLAVVESTCLRTVLDHVEEAEFERAYRRSGGLCLPHLAHAVALFPRHGGVPALLGRAVDLLDGLTGDLRSFIARHDYRRTGPFTDREVACWREAVAFVGGEAELFGNEMPRRPAPGPDGDR
jgi:hypothetical protein